LARDWQQQSGTIFLWQQDIGDCATVPKGPSLRRVRSNELVIDARWEQLHRSVSRGVGTGDKSPVGVRLRLHLEECRSYSPTSPFGVLVRDMARRVGVESRALAVRVLLHLPRVASHKGWLTRWQVERELRISAERLRNDARAASRYLPVGRFQLCDLSFEEIDSSRALPVLTSLHYLRSARPHSRHFALVDPVDGRPVSLCSLSPLNWKCVGSQICSQFDIRPERAWDVSRVYSADNAPPNAISALLSRVRRYLRRSVDSVDLLVTAVDPNLGFTGSSYRASNWQHWMTVRARPYLYENGRYVTPRQLRERFDSSSLQELQAIYPGRFQQSNVRLLDSMIFCSSVNGETKVVLAQDRHRLHR
jgi:hypothetical protein